MIQETMGFIQTEEIKALEIRETVARSTLVTCSSYTESYVKGLEEEIVKLTEENLYLKSDKYRNEISSQDYVKELEDKINKLTEKNNSLLQENNNLLRENNNLLQENFSILSDKYQNKILANSFKEKESMARKISFLSLLVRRLSSRLIDREDILATLKEILKYNG